jgi:hypothetical protein
MQIYSKNLKKHKNIKKLKKLGECAAVLPDRDIY